MRKKYTEEAENYLRESYGNIQTHIIAMKLEDMLGYPVSVHAIVCKARKMGIGRIEERKGVLTLTEVARACNVSMGGANHWTSKLGLKCKKEIGVKSRTIEPEKFWKWAKDAPISLANYEWGGILPEPKVDKVTGRSWLHDRIEQDRAKQVKYKWTEEEDRLVAFYKNQGKSNPEIASKLNGKDASQVAARIYYLKSKKNKSIKTRCLLHVSKEEEQIIWDLYQQGMTKKAIGEELSRGRRTIQYVIKRLEAEKMS